MSLSLRVFKAWLEQTLPRKDADAPTCVSFIKEMIKNSFGKENDLWAGAHMEAIGQPRMHDRAEAVSVFGEQRLQSTSAILGTEYSSRRK
jgi:hypothetical protein